MFFFVSIFINLLWGSVNNGQPLHELHNNKSLRTPGLNQSAYKHYVMWQRGRVIKAPDS